MNRPESKDIKLSEDVVMTLGEVWEKTRKDYSDREVVYSNNWVML